MKKKLAQLFPALIAALLLFPAMSWAALTTNLEAYYDFQGSSVDSTGAHNGTDTAMSYSTPGVVGQKAVFNGSSSQIDIGTSGVIQNNPISLGTWIYITSYPSVVEAIYGCAGSCSGGGLQWYLDSSGLMHVDDSGVGGVTATAAVNLNAWNYVVFTLNGTAYNFYIDGTSAGSGTDSTTAWNVFHMTIGDMNNFWYFGGNMDEFGIWSRDLTSTEVTQLYNGGAGLDYAGLTGGGGPPPPPPFTGSAVWPIQRYDYASSTCVEISTTTPYSYQCNATSTADYVQYSDWIIVNGILILLLAFLPAGFVMNVFMRRK